MSSCECPYDREGDACEAKRPIDCEVTLEAPTLTCSSPLYDDPTDPHFDLLDGDPPCLIFAMDEIAALRYRLRCHFRETPPGFPEPDGFSYFLVTNDVSFFLDSF